MKRLLPAFLLVAFMSCEQFEPPAPSDSAILDGPINGLSGEEIHRFQQGDRAFNEIGRAHV